MKNTKKKLVVICLALVLTIVAAVGTTLAYFTSTTATDTKIMVVGNVKISQNDFNEDDTAFTQDQVLLPAVYAGATVADPLNTDINNEIHKKISINNDGTVPVYARTILAIRNNGEDVAEKIHLVFSAGKGTAYTVEEIADDATIGGKPYKIVVVTYTTPIAAGDTSAESLVKFYLDKTTTQEDMADITTIDGNDDNDDFLILAMSQAVQSTGFNAADAALDEAFAAIENTAESLGTVAGWFNQLANP